MAFECVKLFGSVWWFAHYGFVFRGEWFVFLACSGCLFGVFFSKQLRQKVISSMFQFI